MPVVLAGEVRTDETLQQPSIARNTITASTQCCSNCSECC